MNDQVYIRAGRVAALWCALLGTALAAALALYLGLLQALWPRYALSMLTVLAVLVASAWVLGGRAGHAVLVRGWSGAGVGWLLGVICLLLAVLAGSFINVLIEGEPTVYGWGSALFDYVFKPLFWVMMAGSIAAVVPAGLFARLLARHTRAPQPSAPL